MPDFPGNCAGLAHRQRPWIQTCAGVRYRVISVGTGDRLSAARQQLANITGKDPDGIVLLDASRRIIVIDSVATRLLDLDPRRVLGRDFSELVPHPELLDLVETATGSGAAIGVYEDEFSVDVPALSGGTSFDSPGNQIAHLEQMLGFEDLDGLTTWVAQYLGSQSEGSRGVLALRDGDMMVVWAAWPERAPLITPLRFAAMESHAFRTGLRSKSSEFEPVDGDDCSVIPVIVDGTVAALLVYEGEQEAASNLGPSLGLALRRFIE